MLTYVAQKIAEVSCCKNENCVRCEIVCKVLCSSVCVLFRTNLVLIIKGVVSSRINWLAIKTFMNGQLLKLFYICSESL